MVTITSKHSQRSSVFITVEAARRSLPVPGLAEKRPSVLVGKSKSVDPMAPTNVQLLFL